MSLLLLVLIAWAALAGLSAVVLVLVLREAERPEHHAPRPLRRPTPYGRSLARQGESR